MFFPRLISLFSIGSLVCIFPLCIFLVSIFPTDVNAEVVNFETLPIPDGGFNNGDTSLSSAYRAPFTVISEGENDYGDFETQQFFTTNEFEFGNSYSFGFSSNSRYDYWSGWSWSNVSNTTAGSYLNQYASWTGGGSSNGNPAPGQSYAVAYGDQAWINLPDNIVLHSLDLTNTTYAARTMLDGINGGKKFGGNSGSDADFFSVTLHGFDGQDETATEITSQTVFLADFRFEDANLDYVLDHWLTIDLSSFANVRQIRLSFDGSDSSIFGLNTPTYVALDNFAYSAVPEPNSTLCLAILIVGVCGRRNARHS